MRTVEIDDNGILVDVYCPVAQLHRTDRLNCANKCAWFALKDPSYASQYPHTEGNFAYCQDHCIGRVV